MKKLVVFKSVLGTTQQYAEWLSQKIGADLSRWYLVNKHQLADYDVVVIASGPYEKWDPLAKFLQNNWEVLKDRHVIVLCVGEDPKSDVKWKLEEKIPEDIQKKIKKYDLPGRLNPETAGQVGESNVDPIAEYISGLEKEAT